MPCFVCQTSHVHVARVDAVGSIAQYDLDQSFFGAHGVNRQSYKEILIYTKQSTEVIWLSNCQMHQKKSEFCNHHKKKLEIL